MLVTLPLLPFSAPQADRSSAGQTRANEALWKRSEPGAVKSTGRVRVLILPAASRERDAAQRARDENRHKAEERLKGLEEHG